MKALTPVPMILAFVVAGCATPDTAHQEAADVRYRRLVQQDADLGARIEYARLVCDERYKALTNYAAAEGTGVFHRERLVSDADFITYLELRRAEWNLLAKQVGLIDRIRLRLLCSGDSPPIRRAQTNAVWRGASGAGRSLSPGER
jgi:hypothetical protein